MARKTKRNRKKRNVRRNKKRKTKRHASRRKLNYYKKKFRKFTNKYRKQRKSRKKMRGGSKSNFTYGCNYPENMGKVFTGYANNKNPFLPDPNPLNSNLRPHVVGQKGGGWMNDFGLGDLLLNYYKATDFGKNVWHRYKGNKNVMSSETTHQPELRKNIPYEHKTANVPKFYEVSTGKAAKNTIS